MNTNHYPSLELCKKLTEIGFPMTEKFHMNGGIWDSMTDRYIGEYASWCPSVMEMLNVIPGYVQMEKENSDNNAMYDVYIYDETPSFKNSLPNALAEMILWLHENNYISFSK